MVHSGLFTYYQAWFGLGQSLDIAALYMSILCAGSHLGLGRETFGHKNYLEKACRMTYWASDRETRIIKANRIIKLYP